MSLLAVMTNTVLPVFFLAGLGWIARRALGVEMRDLSRVAVYILMPGLAVHSILGSRIVAADLGKIMAFMLLLTAAMIVLTLGAGRLLGWSVRERSAAVLGTAFLNCANYGLPVVLLAFGQAGFERGIIVVVIEGVLMYTVAVFFAARGRLDWRQALSLVFRLPVLWATAGSMAVRWLGVPVPEAVLKPVELLAYGGIVIGVLLLGMQVATIRLSGNAVKVGVSTLLRLVVSPVVALGLVALVRPDPLTAGVLVLQSATPTAVNTTILASEFGAEPEMVSGVTLATTVLSLATVSFWVWYLQRG